MKIDMKLNINKDQLKGAGKIGLKIAKQIVLDGTKALALKGAKVAIETVFTGQSIKTVKLDDVLSGTRMNPISKFIITNEDEVVDSKTGDIYRKVSPFEQEIVNELKRDIE